MALSCCPPRRQNLGLLQDGLDGGILKIRRIAVLAQYSLDQNPHPGPGRRQVLPIRGCAAFQAVQEFMGDDTEVGVAHDRHCCKIFLSVVFRSEVSVDDGF